MKGCCAQRVNTVMIAATMVTCTVTTKEVECITHCRTAISLYSQWRSSTCLLTYPVSTLNTEHLHTGYKLYLFLTVVYLWQIIHRSRPDVHVTTNTNALVSNTRIGFVTAVRCEEYGITSCIIKCLDSRFGVAILHAGACSPSHIDNYSNYSNNILQLRKLWPKHE